MDFKRQIEKCDLVRLQFLILFLDVVLSNILSGAT